MIVLGLDTATSATAVALRLADGTTREARDDPAPGGHPGHATRLLAMTDELLSHAALGLEQVDRIAVGAGPGTFTGLRVGIATARGLAQSLGAELVAVSSLRALAHGAMGSQQPRALVATIDARRGEVFAAVYSPGEGGLAEGERPVGIGDGAVRYRAELEAAGIHVPADSAPEHLLRGVAIAELGVTAPSVGYGDVLPDYLRRPDAELALEGAGGGAS
jgi:tRNA threonylcarbamoyladenosine biosynthesis protein TsaB